MPFYYKMKFNFNSSYFKKFYSILKYRFLVLVIISTGVGLLDGIGIVAFVPMLKSVISNTPLDMPKSMHSIFGQNTGPFLSNYRNVFFLIIGVFSLKGIFVWAESSLLAIYQQFFLKKLRLSLIDGLTQLEYQKFQEKGTGVFENLITTEIERITFGFRSFIQSFQYIIMVTVYFVLSLSTNLNLSLVLLVGGIFVVIIYKLLLSKISNKSAKISIDNTQLQGLLIQFIHNFKYLKASSAVYGFKQKLETTIHTVEQERKAIGIRNSIFFGVREPLVVSIVLLILFVNFNYMKVEFSVLFILLIFFYRALNTLSLFQSTYNNFLSYSGSLLNVFNQLEEFDNHNSNQIDSNIGNLENEIMDITEIDIKNLGYSFNQNAVFDNLSFKFKNSHIYGVVGKSGSGKTTLLNIISGLYRNYQGEIIVNSDVDLRSISQRKYSKSFGIITQESVIFEDTLFNNITLWDIPNLENQERFLQSIKFAQLEGFLEGLELKGEAQLSADGKNISGGQRQRISIAREIYKGAHVLIFDEPTAALDVETSAFIREKITELRNNHIIILVSHDIDNLDFCDKYLMLKNNEVREITDFKELLEIYSK